MMAGVETRGTAGTAPEILGLPLLDPGDPTTGAVLLIPDAPGATAEIATN